MVCLLTNSRTPPPPCPPPPLAHPLPAPLCSAHGNDPNLKQTETECILKVFTYLDKLIQIVKPKKMLFMAIDGEPPQLRRLDPAWPAALPPPPPPTPPPPRAPCPAQTALDPSRASCPQAWRRAPR